LSILRGGQYIGPALKQTPTLGGHFRLNPPVCAQRVLIRLSYTARPRPSCGSVGGARLPYCLSVQRRPAGGRHCVLTTHLHQSFPKALAGPPGRSARSGRRGRLRGRRTVQDLARFAQPLRRVETKVARGSGEKSCSRVGVFARSARSPGRRGDDVLHLWGIHAV